MERTIINKNMKTMTQTNTPIQSVGINITKKDKADLESMIDAILKNGESKDDYSSLIAELNRATVVDGDLISRNVVTMNSRVSIIDGDTSERLIFTLVFPEDADIATGNISVLSPIGSAMLGYKVGDDIEWAVPGGVRKFTIAKVDYQPEAIERSKKRKL